MNERLMAVRDRRAVLRNGAMMAAVATVTSVVPGAVSAAGRAAQTVSIPAMPLTSQRVVRPELLKRALAALDRHGDRLLHRDRVAIADFAAPSREARFHFVDLVGGSSQSMLVAHGRGSDPSHTGWLSRFSNEDGSFASSEGAFLAGDYYMGKHGRSQRLHGLDATNSNALARAIVVHAAWYSNPDMIHSHGMLGRSEGCFAVGEGDLSKAFAMLGEGRMIYAAKV